MEKWKYQENPFPLNKAMGSNFKVYYDNGIQTPVCSLPCSTSDQQSDTLLERQRREARLIAAAPEMFELLCDLKTTLDFNLYDEDVWDNIEQINKVLNKISGEQE